MTKSTPEVYRPQFPGNDPASLRRLEEQEAKLRRSFAEIGEALSVIRNERLYHARGYKTFESYAQDRWGFGREYAHRLMVGSEIHRRLLPTGNTLPINERQVRELVPVYRQDPDRVVEVWSEAVEAANGLQPSAAAIRAVVNGEPVKPRPDTSKADQKAADAAAHAMTEPIRQAMATVAMDLCIAAVNDATEQLQTAMSDGALNDENMSRLDTACEAFEIAYREARFRREP
jgi:hypothetical protein